MNFVAEIWAQRTTESMKIRELYTKATFEKVAENDTDQTRKKTCFVKTYLVGKWLLDFPNAKFFSSISYAKLEKSCRIHIRNSWEYELLRISENTVAFPNAK